MDLSTYSSLPLGAEFTVRSACPGCGLRNVVTGVIKLVADSPQGALAGGQVKITTHRGAWMTCASCGWEGEGAPKALTIEHLRAS